ncbi:hypothetical protein FACS189443_1730 [Planctomycetales bacterium]|nr:hypothetical protein FACS189443_1730 [Planctomycetales bacterium]
MPYQLNGNQTDKYPSPLNRSNCGNCCPTKDFTYFTTPSNALYYTTYEGYIYVVEPESLTPERLKDSNGKDFILTDYYPYVPASFSYNTGDVTDKNGNGTTDLKNIVRLPKPYHSYLETDDSGGAQKRTEFVGFQDSVNTCIVWRTEYKYNVINGAITLSNILRRVCYQGQYDGAGTPITWSNNAGPCGQFPEITNTTYNPVTTFKTDGNGNPVYHTEYQKNEDGTFKRDANGNKIIDTAKSGGNPELEDNPEKQQWIFTTTVRNVDDCTQENATQATRFSPHWVYGTSGIRTMTNTPSWKWEQCVDCQRMEGLEEDLPELQTCVNDEIIPDCAAHLPFNGFATGDGNNDIEFPAEIPAHYGIPPDKWEFDKTITFPPLEEGGEPSVLTLHCKTHWVKKKNSEATCAMTGYDKQFGWRCEAKDAMIWFPVLQNFKSKMWSHVGNKQTVGDLPVRLVVKDYLTTLTQQAIAGTDGIPETTLYFRWKHNLTDEVTEKQWVPCENINKGIDDIHKNYYIRFHPLNEELDEDFNPQAQKGSEGDAAPQDGWLVNADWDGEFSDLVVNKYITRWGGKYFEYVEGNSDNFWQSVSIGDFATIPPETDKRNVFQSGVDLYRPLNREDAAKIGEIKEALASIIVSGKVKWAQYFYEGGWKMIESPKKGWVIQSSSTNSTPDINWLRTNLPDLTAWIQMYPNGYTTEENHFDAVSGELHTVYHRTPLYNRLQEGIQESDVITIGTPDADMGEANLPYKIFLQGRWQDGKYKTYSELVDFSRAPHYAILGDYSKPQWYIDGETLDDEPSYDPDNPKRCVWQNAAPIVPLANIQVCGKYWAVNIDAPRVGTYVGHLNSILMRTPRNVKLQPDDPAPQLGEQFTCSSRGRRNDYSNNAIYNGKTTWILVSVAVSANKMKNAIFVEQAENPLTPVWGSGSGDSGCDGLFKWTLAQNFPQDRYFNYAFINKNGTGDYKLIWLGVENYGFLKDYHYDFPHCAAGNSLTATSAIMRCSDSCTNDIREAKWDVWSKHIKMASCVDPPVSWTQSVNYETLNAQTYNLLPRIVNVRTYVRTYTYTYYSSIAIVNRDLRLSTLDVNIKVEQYTYNPDTRVWANPHTYSRGKNDPNRNETMTVWDSNGNRPIEQPNTLVFAADISPQCDSVTSQYPAFHIVSEQKIAIDFEPKTIPATITSSIETDCGVQQKVEFPGSDSLNAELPATMSGGIGSNYIHLKGKKYFSYISQALSNNINLPEPDNVSAAYGGFPRKTIKIIPQEWSPCMQWKTEGYICFYPSATGNIGQIDGASVTDDKTNRVIALSSRPLAWSEPPTYVCCIENRQNWCGYTASKTMLRKTNWESANDYDWSDFITLSGNYQPTYISGRLPVLMNLKKFYYSQGGGEDYDYEADYYRLRYDYAATQGQGKDWRDGISWSKLFSESHDNSGDWMGQPRTAVNCSPSGWWFNCQTLFMTRDAVTSNSINVYWDGGMAYVNLDSISNWQYRRFSCCGQYWAAINSDTMKATVYYRGTRIVDDAQVFSIANPAEDYDYWLDWFCCNDYLRVGTQYFYKTSTALATSGSGYQMSCCGDSAVIFKTSLDETRYDITLGNSTPYHGINTNGDAFTEQHPIIVSFQSPDGRTWTRKTPYPVLNEVNDPCGSGNANSYDSGVFESPRPGNTEVIDTLPIPLLYIPREGSLRKGRPNHNLIAIIPQNLGSNNGALYIKGTQITTMKDTRLIGYHPQSFEDHRALFEFGKYCVRRIKPNIRYQITSEYKIDKLLCSDEGTPLSWMPDVKYMHSWQHFNAAKFQGNTTSRTDINIGRNIQAFKPVQYMVIDTANSTIVKNSGYNANNKEFTDKMVFPVENDWYAGTNKNWEENYDFVNKNTIFGNERYSGYNIMSGANERTESHRSIDTNTSADLGDYKRLVISTNSKIYLWDSRNGNQPAILNAAR